MNKTTPTPDDQYQGAIDEVIVHLAAALDAQERAEALDGDEHTARQVALTHPSHGVGASTLAKRWYPSLRYAVERMERERAELGREGAR